MNLRSGYSFSLVKNGLPFDYPKLEKDISTDVLVMGGGISGALTAHYITQKGIGCTIVDARTIGLGSTCASTGLLQYEIDIPLHQLIMKIGERKAAKAYQLCGEAIRKLSQLAKETGMKEFRSMNSLYFAAYKKDVPPLQKEFASRKRHGFSVKWLGEDDIQKKFGFAAPGAILSGLAASTDAYLFTHYLLQHNLNRGLTVYDRSNIVSIRHNRKNVELRTAEGFRINAKKMVYATGYEVVNYIDKPIVSLHSTYAIVSESYSTEPVLGSQGTVIWNTADPYLYMRTTPDKRIMIGGRDEDFFSPAKRDKLIGKKAQQLEKDFLRLYPGRDFKTEFRWTGTFGSTKDGLPYIGSYKKLPNSYFALGFGGNGITFSQVAGEIIANLLNGEKDERATIFSFDRN